MTTKDTIGTSVAKPGCRCEDKGESGGCACGPVCRCAPCDCGAKKRSR